MEDNKQSMPVSEDSVRSDVKEVQIRKKHAVPALQFVVILLAIATGLLTYLLVTKDTETTTPAGNNAQSVEDSNKEAVVMEKNAETSEELQKYMSEEYQFSFNYPSSWGEAEANAGEGENGAALYGTFTENRNVTFGSSTKDYEPYGRDGVCALTILGVRQADGISETEESDSTYVDDSVPKSTSHRTIKGSLYSDESTAISKNFEVGPGGLGSCLGFSSQALVIFDDSAEVYGVRFAYSTRDQDIYEAPARWADIYLEDPTYFYDAEDLDNYIESVKSVKVL